MTYTSALLCCIAVACIGYWVCARSTLRRNHLPLPPGPPGHWLFGNTLPKSYAHRQFAEWTSEYGPVFSLRQGSRIYVIIGRYQAAMDIMEKEGGVLVDRPLNIAAGETYSGGMRMLLVRAGETFKKLRRALHAQLQSKMAETYEPIQTRSAIDVILDILDDPKQHQMHVKRYSASVIMSITYGKTTPTTYADPEVIKIGSYQRRLGTMLRPGSYLVDTFPILRFVPGYLSQLKRWHQEELAFYKGQVDVVREHMASDKARPSFARYLLEKQIDYELNDNELAYLAGSMFAAGSDTTASAITIMIMAAACFPETQIKVQEELDLVVGRDRAPTFGDQELLPQVQAFMLESFRWRPVSIGGFAHRATSDLTWNGYIIPSGATVIGNHWAIANDPDVYPNPERFDPQRWLDNDGKIRDDIKFFTYGFGRRTCPGKHVANRSVFINTALILWAFRITEDPSQPIDTMAFSDTANMHAAPFSVQFEPRLPVERIRDILEASVALGSSDTDFF
ncbi:cytochrome P450 [Leucogyrophana mollusca]|uniref:Cytochrome P450 n=1 Tax=Leucogyrophana mollusca TaxID=85980 RepID=A0ACB8BCL2_9AGAM|nr:cytochrome P450 [Leucogyrophana mollusca]